jgi:hypothetical protein
VPVTTPASRGVTVDVSLRSSHLLLVIVIGLAGLGALSLAVVGVFRSGPAPKPTVQSQAATSAGLRGLHLVNFDASIVNYRLDFRPARPDVRGQIDPARRIITVFVAPDDAPHLVAHDIAHELGHAYDARFMTPALRAQYLAARGRTGLPWWPGTRAADYRAGAVNDYASGAGDFAEVFALCHAPSPEFRSTLAARPQDPCRLIPPLG